MISAPIVLAGATVGAGLAVIAAALRPAPPDLHAALARLDAAARPSPDPVANNHANRARTRTSALVAAQDGSDDASDPDLDRPDLTARLTGRVNDWLAVRGAGRPGGPWPALRLSRFTADLAMLGESVEQLLVRKAGYAVLGLAFPPVLSLGMAAVGLALPWPIPTLASVLFGAVLFLVPDLDIRRRANAARAELRQAVCAYLELVALERAADAGAIEAIERAATIGTSPAFARIRDALTSAQLAGAPPWQGLADLAEQTGVTELGDVADIMRLSGQDGAAVYATLRARSASLRTALTSESAAAANAASEHMIIPVAALGLAFMALVGYPAFARIVFGN